MQFLINLLILSLTLGVVFRFNPLPNVSIYPQDLIAGLIFLFVMHEFLIRREKILEKRLFLMVSAFLLIGFVSLLINAKHLTFQTFLISSAYGLRYAAYASLIFAFQLLDKKFKESLNTKLIITGFIFVLFGFIQYLFYPNLRNLYYLGFDEHLYRLFSTFLDPNFAATFIALYILLLSDNIIKNFKDLAHVIYLSALWVAALAALLFTYSRSGFIMLIVGMGVLLGLYKLYKLIAIIGIFFIALFFLFANQNLEGLNPLRIASVEARIESAKEAIAIFLDNPMIGIGFNAYRYALVRNGFRVEQGTLLSNADAGTDNSYLFVLATTGIVGLVVFVDFWFNTVRIVVRNLNSEFYAKVALASVLGLLVNTVFINSLFYPSIMVWVFILVGLTVNRKR